MADLYNGTILFFDGVCNTCNWLVSFLLRVDSSRRLLFASLQGEAARRLLVPDDFEEMGSLVFRDSDGNFFRQSDAFIAVCRLLPWPWKIFSIIYFVPKFIRDWFYRLFARNRYRLFGKSDACRVPTADERARFLD